MRTVKTTLVLPIRHTGSTTEVLLGFGKIGVSKNKRNGYGGKEEPGDLSIRHRAIDELKDESGLICTLDQLIPVAQMEFQHLSREIEGLGVQGAKTIIMYVYLTDGWAGELCETEAMGDHQWYDIRHLPFEEMIAGEKYWIQSALARQYTEGTIIYRGDQVLAYEVHQPDQLTEEF